MQRINMLYLYRLEGGTMKQMEIIASLPHATAVDGCYEAGCTGVICGLPFLSARQMGILGWDEWNTVRRQCHRLDMKCYVNVNRQFAQTELNELEQALDRLQTEEPDGIYYCDPAVWELCRARPTLQDRLIFDGDTVLTSAADIKQYMRQGPLRCRISQQITLPEVLTILDRVEGRLEYVAVSHLNMSYSKRLLLSCYRDAIGADFDVNAIYELEEEHRNERFLIRQNEQGTEIYTKDVFAAFAEVPVMMRHGLQVVRVDGLLMEEEAMLDAVAHLRRIVEGADAKAEEAAWQRNHQQLTVTKGYLYDRTNISK